MATNFALWRVDPTKNEVFLKGDTGFRLGGFIQDRDKFLERLRGAERQKRLDIFEQICAEALSRIMGRTPVRTGLAQSSWKIAFEDDGRVLKCSITNPVFYVVYLEYGTVHMDPRPMVRITLSEIGPMLKEALETGKVP